MKQKPIFLLLFLFGMAATTLGQERGKPKKAVQKAATQKRQKPAPADTVSLISLGTYQAYGGRALTITDPLIRRLNSRAAGSDVPVSRSGIVGMPRGTYGFANGKILLSRSTAASSGTTFGSGAVGTGTSLMGVGAGQNTPGLNGKNVEASPWFWGSRLPLRNLPIRDSTRQNP